MYIYLPHRTDHGRRLSKKLELEWVCDHPLPISTDHGRRLSKTLELEWVRDHPLPISYQEFQ
jgi:hypothetical protein